VASGTTFRVTGGYRKAETSFLKRAMEGVSGFKAAIEKAATSFLKRVMEGFSQLVSGFKAAIKTLFWIFFTKR
jgi:hypothetical protein